MSVTFPYGVTVHVFREERDPVHGDEVEVEGRDVSGCAVFPNTSSEGSGVPGVGGDLRSARLTTGMTLLAPTGSGITARHRVRLPDGRVFRVDGSPGEWRSPFTGWAPGDQVQLERVEG